MRCLADARICVDVVRFCSSPARPLCKPGLISFKNCYSARDSRHFQLPALASLAILVTVADLSALPRLFRSACAAHLANIKWLNTLQLSSKRSRPSSWPAKTPNLHFHCEFTVRMALRAPKPEEFHYLYTPFPRGRLAASGASTCRSDQPSANDPRLARQDTQLAVSSLTSLKFDPRCSKTQ